MFKFFLSVIINFLKAFYDKCVMTIVCDANYVFIIILIANSSCKKIEAPKVFEEINFSASDKEIFFSFISISLWGISTVGVSTPIMYSVIPYMIAYLLFKFLRLDYEDNTLAIEPIKQKIKEDTEKIISNVELKEAEEKTASGIILPDTAKAKPQIGEIVATGTPESLSKHKKSYTGKFLKKLF